MPEPAPTPLPGALETQLLASRQRFLDFVAAHIDDRALAEDVLQDALVRAVTAAEGLRDESRIVPWFYRILRNAIIDAYRRRDVERRRTEPLADDAPFADMTAEDERTLCECFRALVPTLRPEYADVIASVELGEESPAAAAERLGITPNNLKVRRHRARRALRERLAETCRLCSEHGCLDCTCGRAGGADRAAHSL